MGNQTSSTLETGDEPKTMRRTSSAPSLMALAKKQGIAIEEVAAEGMPDMELSATFSDQESSKENLMESTSKRQKSKPKRRPSFGASFCRRPSFGNSAAMLDLSGRGGLSSSLPTQTIRVDSAPPAPSSEEERRKQRRDRRRRSNRNSGTTNRPGDAAEKPRRRSRSNTRLEKDKVTAQELLETGAFLETLMATPAGQAKLKEVMASKEVMQRLTLSY